VVNNSPGSSIILVHMTISSPVRGKCPYISIPI